MKDAQNDKRFYLMTPSDVSKMQSIWIFRKFVEKFNPIDQAIAEQRYGNLERASFGKSDQERLLTAFKQWKSSIEYFLFGLTER